MTTVMGPITLTLDLRDQVARSREGFMNCSVERVSLVHEYQRRKRYAFSSSI